MLKRERENEIISLLKKSDGFETVKNLCAKLYASESSIRRDLNSLEKQGLVNRIYGGAELITLFSGVVDFQTRSYHNSAEKKAIAEKAAKLVKDGDVLFLDSSSTTFYLAAALMHKSSLTIVTNNVEIISLLSNSKAKVISSGGILSRENRSCLVGSGAEQTFENIFADTLFFSAKSLSDDGVISDCTLEETAVRNCMIKNAKKKVFLCDYEKIGTYSPYRQCGLDDIDCLVCERDVSNVFGDKLTVI